MNTITTKQEHKTEYNVAITRLRALVEKKQALGAAIDLGIKFDTDQGIAHFDMGKDVRGKFMIFYSGNTAGERIMTGMAYVIEVEKSNKALFVAAFWILQSLQSQIGIDEHKIEDMSDDVGIMNELFEASQLVDNQIVDKEAV